ncbi:MAG: hypothetical protein JW751_27910 [Polyangiaceae bacterium]|nr:hypothetical protein [Polyangiaceae bacterium]
MTQRTLLRTMGAMVLLVSVAAGCGGTATQDEREPDAGVLSWQDVGQESVDYGGLTCGDWLAAVRVAAVERCQWDGLILEGYERERRLDAHLAATVCYPNLAQEDCEDVDSDFIARACQSACAR